MNAPILHRQNLEKLQKREMFVQILNTFEAHTSFSK